MLSSLPYTHMKETNKKSTCYLMVSWGVRVWCPQLINCDFCFQARWDYLPKRSYLKLVQNSMNLVWWASKLVLTVYPKISYHSLLSMMCAKTNIIIYFFWLECGLIMPHTSCKSEKCEKYDKLRKVRFDFCLEFGL